jgi:hypothetical protein
MLDDHPYGVIGASGNCQLFAATGSFTFHKRPSPRNCRCAFRSDLRFRLRLLFGIGLSRNGLQKCTRWADYSNSHACDFLPVPPPAQAQAPAISAVTLLAAPTGFASLIVADFSALFTEFRGKRFTLLRRGSSHGFGAPDFHGRCDGHAPTPYGEFGSGSTLPKADSSLTSCL